MSRAARWSHKLANSRYGDITLFSLSFSESTFLPIPFELVLIPHMLANRQRIFRIATLALLGSLAGAIAGYAVGYFLFESLGRWAISTFAWQQEFETFTEWFSAWGFWAVVAIGVLPIPFQVAMLLAGVTSYPLLLFLGAAALARGVRYHGLAALVLLFGRKVEALWRRHSRTANAALLATAIAALAAILVLGNG